MSLNDPKLPEGGIEGEGKLHPEEVRNPEVNYDKTDMSAKAIVGFLIALALAGVLMHLILWGLYKNWARSERAAEPLAAPIESSARQLPQGDPIRTFPPPRIQPDPVADMNKFRVQEEEILRTYGWVDQQKGIVRIPIERAIEIVAQEGLPVRQQPPESARTDMMLAPAPGSGGAMTELKANEMVKTSR